MLYPFAVLRGAALVQWRLTKTRARLCSCRDADFLGRSDFDADVCEECHARDVINNNNDIYAGSESEITKMIT